MQPSIDTSIIQMNWIMLIVAGLCEVGFTYCLGRTKGVIGSEWWTWIAAFAVLYVLSAVLLAKATQFTGRIYYNDW